MRIATLQILSPGLFDILQNRAQYCMSNLRLGDIIDDYCAKCRRLTNHAIVSIVNEQAAKVRCRSCYHDHDYLHEQIPPSKKDLKKLELFNSVLSTVDPAAAADSALPELPVDESVLEEIQPEPEETETSEEPPAVAAPATKKARGRTATKKS
jgi:hypothetical protein